MSFSYSITQFKISFILIFFAITFLLAPTCLGAHVSLTGENSEFNVNNKFRVDLMLHPADGEVLNAIEGSIVFDTDIVQLNDIRFGNSIISLWIDEPEISENRIRFSGIIPGGYHSLPGPIFSLIFEAVNMGSSVISLNDFRVLLHDGLGSEADLSLENFDFTVLADGSLIEDMSDDQILDVVPPENFSPLISRGPHLFDDQWFVVFLSQDKGSGIDAYFVYESPKFINPTKIKKNDWQLTASPYLLSDQTLKSYVYIKAVDRAGNERIEMISPAVSALRWYQNYQNLVILIVSFFIFWLIIRYLWKKVIPSRQ